MDRKLLEAIIERFGGGPVGLDNIAAAIGEVRDTIEDVIEPYLIQQGLLQRTPAWPDGHRHHLGALRPAGAHHPARSIGNRGLTHPAAVPWSPGYSKATGCELSDSPERPTFRPSAGWVAPKPQKRSGKTGTPLACQLESCRDTAPYD